MSGRLFLLSLWFAGLISNIPLLEATPISLPPAHSAEGFIARLLINEAPFPGERGYVSEANTRAAMEAILLTLDARANRVPPNYTRKQVADTASGHILDIITAGGVKGQVDGFYRDSNGNLLMVARVHQRVANLLRIANQGKPGRFARLLTHAVFISRGYLENRIQLRDPFAQIRRIGPYDVTGSSYAWMTDHPKFHPRGYFVSIPNSLSGSLGGNRFFTLKTR